MLYRSESDWDINSESQIAYKGEQLHSEEQPLKYFLNCSVRGSRKMGLLKLLVGVKLVQCLYRRFGNKQLLP